MTAHHPNHSAQIEEKTQCSLPSKMDPPDPSMQLNCTRFLLVVVISLLQTLRELVPARLAARRGRGRRRARRRRYADAYGVVAGRRYRYRSG